MSTVFCTTRNRAKRPHRIAALGLLLGAGHSVLLAQATSSAGAAGLVPAATEQADIEKVTSANDLTGEGRQPFHLKLSYEMFSLSGEPGEKGVADYQWASPQAHQLDVTSPSLGTLHYLGMDATPSEADLREMHLVQMLLNAVLHPGEDVSHSKNNIVAEDRKVGGVVLSCLEAGHTEPGSTVSQRVHLCVDNQNNVRLITNPTTLVVRNRPAKFAGTLVDLDVQITLSGRIALRGHVEGLTGLDPAIASTLAQPAEPQKANDSERGSPSEADTKPTVQAGSALKRVPPGYPSTARDLHISGSVLFAAQITEVGMIGRLVPLASPSPVLTEAAETAVKQWTYTPYLLNGKPTKVDTEITVNFNLNGGGINR